MKHLVFLSTLFMVIGDSTVTRALTMNTLENGLVCYLDQDHTAPLVALIAVVHCGSVCEAENESGMSHLLEHLLFDGTERRTQGQMQQEVESYGGYVNAFTRKEYTLFMVVVPSQFLPQASDLLADMLYHSTIPVDQFTKEQKVVLEELEQERDMPMTELENLLESILFADTSYSRPVTGNSQAVAAISRDMVYKYYKNYYTPSNTTLIVVGDVNPQTAESALNPHFGALSMSPKPLRCSSRPALPEGSRFIRYAKLPQPRLILVYPAPHAFAANASAITLITEWLSGAAGKLQELTIGEQALASSVSGYVTRYREFSYLTLELMLKDNSCDEAEQAVDRILTEVAEKGLPDEDLAGVKTGFTAGMLFEGERFDHRAWDYAAYEVLGDIAARARLEAELAAVTNEMVRSVAQQYLTLKRRVRIDVLVRDHDERQQTPLGATQATLSKTLPTGLTIAARSNPYRDLTAVSMLIRNRSIAEPMLKAGLSDITAQCLMGGTDKRSRTELLHLLTRQGIRVQVTDDPYLPFDDYYFSPDYLSIRMEIPGPARDLGLDLLAEIILHPAFTDADLERVKAEQLSVLKLLSRKPSEQAHQAMRSLLYPDSSYNHPLRGAPDTVQAITLDDLITHYQTLFRPSFATIAIVGNDEPSTLISLVEQRFGEWGEGESLPLFTEPLANLNPATENRELASAQSTILWARPYPLKAEEPEGVLDLVTELLTARMTAEIREKHGLAYSLGAGVRASPSTAVVTVSVSTRAGNESKVTELLTEVMAIMQKRGLDSAELDRAKNSLIGRRLRYRLRRINQAHFLALALMMGRGVDGEAAYEAQLQQVTTSAVQALAQDLLQPAEFTKVQVGPQHNTEHERMK